MNQIVQGFTNDFQGTFLNITEKISRKIKPVKHMKTLSDKSVVWYFLIIYMEAKYKVRLN